MVNKGRNNLKWYDKTNITKVINNNGLSSKSIYRFINWGNKSQQYKKGYNNRSCWGTKYIGIHNTDGWSRYDCVKKIQLKQGKKDALTSLLMG